jgi:hypothetical protein
VPDDGTQESSYSECEAEEEWEVRAQLASTKRTLKKQSVVIWVPEPDLRKIGKPGASSRKRPRPFALHVAMQLRINCLLVTPTAVTAPAVTATASTTVVSLIPGTVFPV